MAFTRGQHRGRHAGFLQPLQRGFTHRTDPRRLVGQTLQLRYGRFRDWPSEEASSQQAEPRAHRRPPSSPTRRCHPDRRHRVRRRHRGRSRPPGPRTPREHPADRRGYAGWRAPDGTHPRERRPSGRRRRHAPGQVGRRRGVHGAGQGLPRGPRRRQRDGRAHRPRRHRPLLRDAQRQPRPLRVVHHRRRRPRGLVDLPRRGLVRPLRDVGARRRHQDRRRGRRGPHVRRGRPRAPALRRGRPRPGRRRVRDRQGRRRAR